MKDRLTRLIDALSAAAERRPELAGDPDLGALIKLLSDEHGDAEALVNSLEDPLARIAEVFGLSDLDTDLLFVAASVDLDQRLSTVYSLLAGGAVRQRPTVGLALELCGYGSLSTAARHRLSPTAPLRRQRLLRVDGPEPFLWRSVSVPERIVGQLLGDESPAVEVAAMLLADTLGQVTPEAERLGRSFLAGARVGHVKARPGTSGLAVARGTFESLGLDSIVVDLSRRRPSDDPVHLTALATREAGLLAGGLIVTGADDVTAAERAMLASVELSPVPVVVVDNLDWKGDWLATPAMTVDAHELDRAARIELWSSIVDDAERASEPDLWRDLVGLRLTTEEILAAARAATVLAAAESTEVNLTILRDCARRQGSTSLAGAALRVQPRVSLDDVELTERTREAVDDLLAWGHNREALLGSGSLAGKGAKGRGLTALFAGSPGTGKTLAAEAIAGELGLDLYIVDLATIVDKYIGETEKNLERVIREAESLNVVLFFDEADSLFGSRSDVRDARDRYANQEVAYLLQRIERFEGIAILATNLRGNIDQAFSRRLHHIITFVDPDEPTRRRLWQTHLAEVRALDADDPPDLDWLAANVEVTGGMIRNMVLAAAFTAAAKDTPVGMRHLLAAMHREYQKVGRRAPTTG